MKFGLVMFGLNPKHYPKVAQAAEANGFESIWMPEHLVFPAEMPATYPYAESGLPPVVPETPLYDPWVVLGAVASVTSTIRLATNVFILPLRHPVAVARTLVTLDRVSDGRVTLGAGVGWLEEEFSIMGIPFRDRGARTDEMIELLRRLWSEDVIEHHGDHFDLPPVRFAPKPVQKPSIPIELGGAAKPALRRAARLGDGWIEIGSGNVGVLADRIAFIHAERAAVGRADLPFEVTAGFGSDADAVRGAAEVGVTRVTAGPTPSSTGRVSVDDFVDFTKRYADEVIAAG